LAQLLADAVARTGRVDRATHGFHAYPAALHPDAAALLLTVCDGPVHDPFCGGGTVPVEAALAGRASTGFDLSPIAALVAGARLAGPSMATPVRSAARRLAKAAQLRTPTVVPEACVGWYEPHVADELGRLRDGIAEQDPTVQPLLQALLSSIAVKVSFRESDTVNRRTPHHRPPGTTAILFHKKARELGRKLDAMPTDSQARITLADARAELPDPDVGLIITSPPYPGVYDYLPMQQLRLAWLGLEAPMQHEIGSRRAFRAQGRANAVRQWRADTREWIRRQVGGLRSGARVAIMVGDGLVAGRNIDALSPTVESLRAAGAEVIARASADRPDHARERIRTEHLVLAERGERRR